MTIRLNILLIFQFYLLIVIRNGGAQSAVEVQQGHASVHNALSGCFEGIIEGEEDKTTPMREAQAYTACFAQCDLQTISGGHFAFAEHPVAFNIIAEEFFYG